MEAHIGIGSLPTRPWVVRTPPCPEASRAVAARLGLPPVVAELLVQRGHGEPESARRFLEPHLGQLEPPRGLPHIDRAARRVAEAIAKRELVAVCGDYDVDGMTGTALLMRFFRLVGANAMWSIPDRETEGYGLGVAQVDRLHAAGVRLAITVDNGVSAHAALQHAASLGIDVVVTDHHVPGPTLPPAHSLVVPLTDEATSSGMRNLCGCALAFKLAWAVADRVRARMGASGDTAFKQFLHDALAWVAIATVADHVPLVGENRVLAAAGMAALRKSTLPGFVALREVAELGDRRILAEDVAFRLAPRINAAGRLSQPHLAIELFLAEDLDDARRLAQLLDEANTERRRIEQGVTAAAIAVAEQQMASCNPPAIVVAGAGWHLGVIGIVAARLVDRFQRPALVVGLDGERGRGSGRAPPGVDLFAALGAAAAHLERFGGHAAAAGFEVRLEAWDRFVEAFQAGVRGAHQDGEVGPPLHLDATSRPEDWTLDAVEALGRLEPFGRDHAQPIFFLPAVCLAGRPRLMGAQGKHLSFAVRAGNGAAVRVVGWNGHAFHDLVARGAPFDLAATPFVDEWNGTRSVGLRLVAARPLA